MRVLLVMPPNWGVEMPPLGISYIASALKQDGHEVKILDYNLKIWHQLHGVTSIAWAMNSFSAWVHEEQYEAQLRGLIKPKFEALLEDVREFRPDVLGFSVFATSIFPVRDVIEHIRPHFPEMKIILGGPQVRDEYAHHVVWDGLADAAVIGEGEGTVREILRLWQNQEPIIRPVLGAAVAVPTPERVLVGKDRPALEMDELPFPDFSEVPLETYLTKSLPFSMSRGCIKRCTFCSEAPFWKRYRTRSAKSIFRELKHAHDTLGIKNFLSHDSLMNGNFEVLEELADLIIADGLKITWQGMCRLDKRMTPALLEKLKFAGCSTISYGLESGSQKIADLMKKGVKITDALQVIKDSHAAGIVVNVFIIVGFPRESWLDFMKTMVFLFRIRRKIFLANVSDTGVMKGAPMQLRQKQFGIVENSLFRGEWHDKYYLNTIYHRKFKLWLMRKYINALRIHENKLIQPVETLFELPA